jgi:hypothetical protein
MSFLRHGKIYHFDEGAIPRDHALPHRNDEFPAGYSLAGCTPAEPASASPVGSHLAGKPVRGTIEFQRTAGSVLTVCLSPGDNPKGNPPFPAEPRQYPSDTVAIEVLSETQLAADSSPGIGSRSFQAALRSIPDRLDYLFACDSRLPEDLCATAGVILQERCQKMHGL